MPRPLFSDMLLDRRRQLGLSIKQASNVLRLKEEVLVAFEEGDFESIPKSGYAQGMLSSYARYLGLNAKTVVSQFSQDLFEYERGSTSHEARRRSRMSRGNEGPLYEVPQAAAPRSQRAYVEPHGFLPTAGGYAGDMGDFATTSAARPRYSSASADDRDDDYPQQRRYTARVPLSSAGAPAGAATPLGQPLRQRPGSPRRTASSLPGVYDAPTRSVGHGVRDEVTTRRIMPSQYRDDMRLDNDGRSYESASSVEGRRSSRNIASTERPNVRRRGSRGSREQLRNRDRYQAQGSGGLVGLVGSFFQDRTRVMILLIALLFLILTCTIVFSVSSCVSKQQSTGRSVSVTESDASDKDDKDDSSTMTSAEEERARADAAAAKAAESESSETERTFEVTVAEGEVTWIEIEYDGTSDIAETVTGPWNRTYTVRQAISINVNDTSAVTVTENGKKLEFDSKASGIGTISIQVSKKSGTDETGAKDGEASGQATDGTQAVGDASQQTGDGGTDDAQTQQQPSTGVTTEQSAPQQDTSYQQQDSSYQQQETTYQQQDYTTQQTTTGGSMDGYTLDSDGYFYGADGYYDAQGNFYEYS